MITLPLMKTLQMRNLAGISGLLVALVCQSLITPFFSFAQAQVGSKHATGKRGMVVSAHPLASEIGLQVLKDGGNAFDAGIAVEFALAVCFPVAGNIGGGGFGMYRTAKGQVLSLDYRETAPLSASAQDYLGPDGKVRDSLLQQGSISAGIPGTVPGMLALHKRLGSRPWTSLVAPAIKLAKEGFSLTEGDAALLNKYQSKFRQVNPKGCPFIHPEGKPWQQGQLLKQPALAKTLLLIQKAGTTMGYPIVLQQPIVSDMKTVSGAYRWSLADLRNYQPRWRMPVTFQVKNYRISSMAPPSSGGTILNMIFGMAKAASKNEKDHNLDSLPIRLNPDKLAGIQNIIELERLAYADRSEYLGDPDFVKVPLDSLLDKAYHARRFPNWHVGPAVPSTSIGPGLMTIKGGEPVSRKLEHEETTHYTVVDAKGNAVAATTTLNGPFGSGVVLPLTGILLNNEMDDFSVLPGVPNAYGLVGGKANAIAPGKRMLSSMSPTIVQKKWQKARRRGEPDRYRLVGTVGTPGGSTIPTTTLQVLLRMMLLGESPAAAVAHPRFHHQWLPDVVKHEANAFSPRVKEQLEQLGYKLQQVDKIGRAEAIWIDNDGTMTGGADPRGDDTALGW